MGKEEQNNSLGSDRKIWWVVVLIAAAGTLLRAYYYVGVSCADDSAYLYFFRQLASGEKAIVAGDVFANRWMIFYPMYALSVLFGQSESTVLIWPLICGALEIFLSGYFAYRCWGPSSAVLAAFMLAVFPPHIILSTRTMPDVIVSAFCTLSMIFFVLGRGEIETSGNRMNRYFTLSGLVLGLGYLARPTAFFILLPYALYSFTQYLTWRKGWVGFMVLCLAALSVLGVSGILQVIGGYPITQQFEILPIAYSVYHHNEGDLYYYLRYLVSDETKELSLGAVRWLLYGSLLFAVPFSFSRRLPLLMQIWLWSLFLYLQFGVSASFLPINKELRFLSMLYCPAIVLAAGGVISLVTQLLIGLKKLNLTKLSFLFAKILPAAFALNFAFVSWQPLQESYNAWWKSAPPCNACKVASSAVKRSIEQSDISTVVLEESTTASVMANMYLIENNKSKKLVLLRGKDKTADPFQNTLERPFLYVDGLGQNLYGNSSLVTDRSPRLMIADLGPQDCNEPMHPRIYLYQ